eukprot:5655560-Pyramimonas_sp.AAC.1
MGVNALRLIDLGDWPEGLEEEELGNGAAPEASSYCADGSQPPDLGGQLRPWRVCGHTLLVAPIFDDETEHPAMLYSGLLLFCTTCR